MTDSRGNALKRDFDDILARFGEALALPKSDIVRDSAILRFELTFEVAWKLCQRLVREQGLEANSPRQAFQQAFTLGWISDKFGRTSSGRAMWRCMFTGRNMPKLSTASCPTFMRRLGSCNVR